MSATEHCDPDIEAIVQEFSDLLRRRLYELRGAYSGVLEAEASVLQAAVKKLRAAAQPLADCGPTATEIRRRRRGPGMFLSHSSTIK